MAGLLFKIRSYNLGKIEIWLDTLVSDRFKNITRGRDFAHVDKLSIFDPRDVRPLKHCLMSLLTIVDHKEIKDIKEIKNVYSLPPQSKIITGRSVSTKTHTLTTVYLGSALPLADIEAKFEYIFDIFSKSTLWKLWKRELLSLKYDVEKKSKELFSNMYRELPFSPSIIKKYMVLCVLLAIPFWNNFSYEIKEKLLEKLGFSLKADIMEMGENNIWNVFSNVLPIEMPII